MTEPQIINLTPVSITIETPQGKWTIIPSGTIARATERETSLGSLADLPITSVVYDGVEGLPAPTPDTYYIVSTITAEAALRVDPTRVDLLTPGTPVRDAQGRVVGATSLRRASRRAIGELSTTIVFCDGWLRAIGLSELQIEQIPREQAYVCRSPLATFGGGGNQGADTRSLCQAPGPRRLILVGMADGYSSGYELTDARVIELGAQDTSHTTLRGVLAWLDKVPVGTPAQASAAVIRTACQAILHG